MLFRQDIRLSLSRIYTATIHDSEVFVRYAFVTKATHSVSLKKKLVNIVHEQKAKEFKIFLESA
jgi:hypothetical protein